MNVRKITACALFIALATILSLIKLYRLPFGGDVTAFSMLVIVLPAWIYGVREGMLCGLIFGLIQFILGAYIVSIPQVLLDYVFAFSVMGVAGVFAGKRNAQANAAEAPAEGGPEAAGDEAEGASAYKSVGAAPGCMAGAAAPSAFGKFISRHSLACGYSLAIIARWAIATAAGLAWIAAGSTAWSGWAPLPYSMAYNGAYIFTEAIVTLIVISTPPLKKALNHIKSLAQN